MQSNDSSSSTAPSPKLPLHVHLNCSSRGVTIPSILEACLDATKQLEESSCCWTINNDDNKEELGVVATAMKNSPSTSSTPTSNIISSSSSNTIWDKTQSQLAKVLFSKPNNDDEEQMMNLDMIEKMLFVEASSSSSKIPSFVKETIMDVLNVWSMTHVKVINNENNKFTTDTNIMIFPSSDVWGIAAITLILQEYVGITSFSCSPLPLELPTIIQNRNENDGHHDNSSSMKKSNNDYASTMVVPKLLLGMTTFIVNSNHQGHSMSDEGEYRKQDTVTPAAAALLRVLTIKKKEQNNNAISSSSSNNRTITTQEHYRQQMAPLNYIPLTIGVGHDESSTTCAKKENGPGNRPLLHVVIGQDASFSTTDSTSPSPIPLNSSKSGDLACGGSDITHDQHELHGCHDKIATTTASSTTMPQKDHNSQRWKMNTLTHLEANLDDTTPEVLAFVIETLLKKGGAVDAWVTPIVMKKGRAAHTLHCLVREEENNNTEKGSTTNKVLEIMFRETTTLGIRIQKGIERAALRREFVSVQTPYATNNHRRGKVDVKVGYLGDDVVSVKAEFDHCREIAQGIADQQISLTQIRQSAERQVWDMLPPAPSLSSQQGNIPNNTQNDLIVSSFNALNVLDHDNEEQAATAADKNQKLPGLPKTHVESPLKAFDLYGWKPNPSLSDDENYMDMMLLITRSSKCRQGSMACLLVRPSTNDGTQEESVEELEYRLNNNVLSAATNQPLFRENDSDVHAEIAALGIMTQSELSTFGCTSYITMPPCKRCFGALHAAGVKRIVTRLKSIEPLLEKAAQLNGIQMVTCSTSKEQMARINDLVKKTVSDDSREALAK